MYVFIHTHTQAELYILLWNFLQDILFSYKNKEQNGVYSLLPFKFKKEEERLPWWFSGTESACQCRRHEFDPWSGKIPYATEQLSLCTTTTERVLWSPRTTTAETCVPRSLCSTTGKAVTVRSLCTAARMAPTTTRGKKSSHSNEDAAQPKINKNF